MKTCEYCGASFEVPEGYVAIMECTRDTKPPAEAAALRVKEGHRLPENWNDPEIFLHYCKRGIPQPKCPTCKRYALVGDFSSCSNPFHGPNALSQADQQEDN